MRLNRHMRLVFVVVGVLGTLWLLLPVLLPGLALTHRPVAYVDLVEEGAYPISHISLPVEVPLSVLEQRLTRELDASLAGKREDSDFKAWRSGKLRIHSDGHGMRIDIPLSFKSSAGPDTRGSLVVSTRINADFAPDWRPRVHVRSTFDWTKKPKVKLLLFKVRVSGVVGRQIGKKLHEWDNDLKQSVISALTLRPRAETWWQGLFVPDQITDDPPIWLSTEPQYLFYEPLGGDGKNLKLTLGLRARLSTSIARQPPAMPPRPLPEMQRATSEDSGFALHLPVLADYAGLARRMNEELSGREIQLERGAITPTGFTLYTSGRSLVVGIDFRGDAPGFWMDTRGTVFFTGEPRFDPSAQILRIENFQFTRRLNNPLVSTATWVLHDSLRQKMQERLVWDLRERLSDGARKLSGQLNQPLGDDLQMTGEVTQLSLTGIHCRLEGIQIGLKVRGHLKIGLIGQQQDTG